MFNLVKILQEFLSKKTIRSKHHKKIQGEAIVSQEIRPHMRGRVHFRGSWWFAYCEQNITLAPNNIVEVVGIYRNITLLVKPKTFE